MEPQNKITISINENTFTVDSTMTILQACRANGFYVPTLCHLENVLTPGACRMCVVEVDGARSLVTACTTPITKDMKIKTNSERVISARKINFQFLMASHEDCLSCAKNHRCELQTLGSELGIKDRPFKKNIERKMDTSAPAYTRDNEKCILCQRCINVCDKIIGVSALGLINRGHQTMIGHAFNSPIIDSVCIECGQCVIHCPTGALVEKRDIDEVLKEINDPKKVVIVQTAPAVRSALGEGFGYEPGTLVTGKMVEALKRIGFDRVLDTSFGADITIMEEGFELLERLQRNENLPQFTSCCPAWVKYVETHTPELIPYLSTAKSPHQMLASVIKVYYSKLYNVNPKDIVTVSIMPCTAKKYERERAEMKGIDGLRDVDYVLTTRELIAMITISGINFKDLPDRAFDSLGEGTGAGDIFGASGGVMEAALRTAYEVKTGQRLEKVEFDQIRGDGKVKEGKIIMEGKEIRFLVVATPKMAKPFILEVLQKKSPYHFIEVMTCPGGCVGGGGQPIPTTPEIVRKRMNGLYLADSQRKIRRSYENPVIKELYANFFGKPLSETAEKYLHTSYQNKRKY